MKDIEVKRTVGKKIKKFRQKNGLTQFKLGELVDINQRQIALIESGKSFPSLTTLVKFTEVFNCNIADFFEAEPLVSERDLKDLLIEQIEKADYSDCKRLYSVMTSFLNI